LTRDTITIGRDITNDIVINDPEVSRHHSRLVRTATGYAIEDLRSTNGTFVNRQRITNPHQLSHGDLIGLGETVTLVFESSNASSVGSTLPGSGSSAAPPPSSSPPAGGQPQAYSPAPPPAPGPVAQDTEEEGPDVQRLIVIGCGVLAVLFCCLLVGGVIAVDYFNLYCDLPLGAQLFPGCVP
jgi:pSer/pThr/pTyr-binding forkhead associated (FHA) protein